MRVPLRLYTSLLALVLLVACFVGLAGGRSSRTRLIDTRGRQIASVFYGANPNPKYALEFQRRMSAKAKGALTSSCSLVNGVYHPSRKQTAITESAGPTVLQSLHELPLTYLWWGLRRRGDLVLQQP